jgi:hypothetical protein
VTKFFAALSTVVLIAGAFLALTGSEVPGIILIVVAFVIAAILGAIATALRVRNSIREWTGLLSGGGPDSVRVVNVEPPQGWLFNREASITLELKGKDGTTKQVQKGMPVPIPQAIMWRLAGRVPTPLGRLTEARELDLAVYRKRGT